MPANPLGAQLTVLDVRTGKLNRVGQPVPAQPISWSADGSQVAVSVLAPYSRRYREGIYELAVVDIADSGKTVRVRPEAHSNILDAVLTPDGLGMSYVTGAQMWRVGLNEELEPQGAATLLTHELTDTPSWASSGDFVVYMNGDRMKRLEVATGTVDDITPPLPWRRALPDKTWLLRAGRVFDSTGDSYREKVDIVVRGYRIESIGPWDEDTAHPVVDARQHTVIPGLFEMHAHMGPESGVQGRDWLAWGVTTVRDPGSSPHLAKARQEAWDSDRRIGPRTHVTGYLTDGNRVFYSLAEGVVSDAHLELTLERAEALQLDFIKTYVRLPDAQQRRVVEFAHSIGIPVSSHEIFPAVAHGMDHVEHIGGTSRRGYAPKVSQLGRTYGDVIELLAQSGMGITATAVLPGFAVTVATQDDLFESRQFQQVYGPKARAQYGAVMRRFGSGAAATVKGYGEFLSALVERDALLVTGTDAPFVPYGPGLHAELRIYEAGGLTPAQVLRAATIQSARAAGVDADLGTLEAGKLADFVVVDGDPLATIADADNVVMTVLNGRAHSLEELLDRGSAGRAN